MKQTCLNCTHCTCQSLTRLALLNSTWAARIAVVLTDMWKGLAKAKQRWNAVQTLDDMEELWGALKGRFVLTLRGYASPVDSHS